MFDFTHLHVHTEYSLLDGASKIKDLLDTAAKYNMNAIAITDHGNMYGVLEFYREAVKRNIKPIIGCEMYVAEDMSEKTSAAKEYSHLILLAKDNEGYRNLIKLSTLSYSEGFYYKPRIDYKTLREYSKGLICMSACLAGDIPQFIMRGEIDNAKKLALDLKKVFGEDFYLELQNHGIKEQQEVNEQLINMSKELGIPLAATNDVHYVREEDAQAQDILMCIQTGRYLDETDRMRFETQEFYLKSQEQMNELFSYIPEAIENTGKIAEKCNVTFNFDKVYLPEFIPPKGFNGQEYLRHLCEEGLLKRVPNVDEKYVVRLDYELNVINQMGFTDYFLIVYDYVNFAKQNGIYVGPGRGSAAGSLVAYTLRITDIDPLEYDLLFERFLNPERVSMPDIDIDFCVERRSEVKDYIVKKYGQERVAQIITFNTLKAKLAIKDVARVLRCPPSESDRISKMVPFSLHMTIDRAMEENPRLKAEYDTNENVRNILDIAKKLEGLPRNASVHAAGLVISKDRIDDYVPLQTSTKVSGLITQFTKDDLESLGLLKMDLLGLTNLTVIRHTIDMVKQNKGIDIDIQEIGLNDKEVYKLIGEGDTDGVFQLESSGMRALMMQLKPKNLGDIMAGISLYRPGPMESIPVYLEAKKHPNLIKYKHPSLKSILAETYGCMVYQEQVMEIVRALAGYSLGRSDLVRRAMSKKKESVLRKEKNIFINGEKVKGKVVVPGAVALGVPKNIAEEIFDQVLEFADYGFNKSHACVYAVIAYWTAYLKRYHRLEFLTALINSYLNNPDKVAFYIAYLKKCKIQVLGPDINESDVFFKVTSGAIRFGLVAIRDVGEKVASDIIAERDKNGKYTSFNDFLNRNSDAINKKMLEALILSGCFDSLTYKRSQLMNVYEKVLSAIIEDKKRNLTGQMSIFDIGIEDEDVSDEMPDIPEFKERHKLSMEKRTTGMYLSGHPLNEIKDILDKATFNTYVLMTAGESDSDMDSIEGREVELVGILTSVHRRSTRLKKLMANAVLEDLFGTVNITVFPGVFAACEQNLAEDQIVIVRGKVEIAEGEAPSIIASSIVPFTPDKYEFLGKTLCVKVPKEAEKGKDALFAALREFPGASPVNIYIEGTNQKFKTTGRWCVNLSNELIYKLRENFGENNVVLK
ncbi:MAG: DNA polymerase III subunit alpha [Eubacteriales bacterium]